MASGRILPAPQLSKLKNDVVHLLVQSCKGHCVDLSSFEEKYKDFYGIEFFDQYPSLKEWRLLDVMKELKDVISLRESRSSVHIVWNPTSISSPLLPFADVASVQFAKTPHAYQPSFREIMRQQEQEYKFEASAFPPLGNQSLLTEIHGAPSPLNQTRVHFSPEQQCHVVHARETGTLGPMEKSFEQAQRIMSTVNSRSSRQVSVGEINTAAGNIIASLSDMGEFVSLEKVKAKLCLQFGKFHWSGFGFKRDKDIPALDDLIKLQNKVSLFVHAFVMCNSIATVYELGQSLADLESKRDFEDLRLGPLLQQPVVFDLFKAPSDLSSLPPVTTIQILRHLEKYMTREDLWHEKVDLGKFMEYLCEEYDCETPYELGVRIQSIGLAISVIKKAKRSDSVRWNIVREQYENDLNEEIERHLKKIKKKLLGQEVGDLRSCAMKLIGTSPVNALQEIFDCCLDCFEGENHEDITNFLATITENTLGRRLFQLALTVSCRNLIGETLDSMVQKEVDKQIASRMNDLKEKKELRAQPPSEGAIADELKAWLVRAENIDLQRLANIEASVLNKFPDFHRFEDFGYGSFLTFLTARKELLEAIEEVGGLTVTRSGGLRSRLGHHVSLTSVLDFISQCGPQASPDAIEWNLCNYCGICKVTDLGFDSLSNLLKKANDRRGKMSQGNTPAVVYEAALMFCERSNDLEAHKGSILGFKTKEDALAAIQSTPLLEDVNLWTHWDDVFGGEASKLGDLKSFLENEGILMNAGKSTSGKQGSLVVMETSPGVLLRLTTITSTDIFHKSTNLGDAVGAAGHLVSMVMINGGVSNTPVALLANHVQSSLASMAAHEGHDRCSDFVLNCLVRMPSKLAQTVGAKVFLEPLKKLFGSTEAPSLLLSHCSNQSQRYRLHQLGFVLGLKLWIEDFNDQVRTVRTGNEEDDSALRAGLREEELEFSKKPIAVVNPVASFREKTEKAEGLARTLECNALIPETEGSDLINDDVDGNDIEKDTAEDVEKHSREVTDTQEDECRAVIEQIRREEFGIGLELGEEESKLVRRQREREGRGLHRLSSELYSRDTHFVLELVQNADDNSYPEDESVAGFPSLVFVLEKDRIVVLNNEVGFMEKNIRALCDVGKSTKGAHRYGYIGQKGIGFKSVFRVSDCPEVHSNGYHIRFDAKSGPIGYILPQWIEEGNVGEGTCDYEFECFEAGNKHEIQVDNSSEYERWSTRIVLPLKEEHKGLEKSSLHARFRDIHPSLLLFLHRLRAIRILDQVSNTRREMIRRDLGDNIMEVSHTKGKDRWLLIKKELDASNVPTKENVATTELALAFPFSDVDPEPGLERRHKALPQQNVFAYLPLRSYGFRFIIQGDFEVPSSREDVDSDKSWNQWLREEIPKLFIEALSVFMNHPSFSDRLSSLTTYLQFVPLEEEILDFFTPVARHILTLLQGKPCVAVKTNNQETSTDNWLRLPSQAIFCQDCTIQDLITPALLEEHLSLFYLHSEMEKVLNPTLRSRLGIDTLSSKHLLEIAKSEMKKLVTKTDATDGDHGAVMAKISWLARWLQCVHRCLDQERDSSQETLDSISSLDVIPLTDGSCVNLKGDSIFLPLSMNQNLSGTVQQKKKSLPNENTCLSILETDLSTVHPDLFSSLDDIGRSQVEQLLRRLGVKTWNPKDLVNSHIIPTFKSDKWQVKSDKVLASYLAYIFEQRLSDPSVCDINDLRSCVQILTNKGPLNPVEASIHFTARFGNAIDLAKQLPSISWTLVDESYLDSGPGSKARTADWKAFLEELGVQTFLSIKRKRVKLQRSSMAESPWSSFIDIWQTTPDGLYFVEDWACEEFEEFLSNVCAPGSPHRRRFHESKLLAQYIDERWDKEYSKYADDGVHLEDSKGHSLGKTKSSFYLNLVFKPWMSARGVDTAFFAPKDLYMDNTLVSKLLEDHVYYASADLKSDGFRSILGIHESISVDELLREMEKWSSPQSGAESLGAKKSQEFTTCVAHMSEVYFYLFSRMLQNEDDKRKISDFFEKSALIFVPDPYPESSVSREVHTPGSFYLKKDVCWQDPTGLVSKYFKEQGMITRRLLQGYYCRPSMQWTLDQFFVGQLNVDETPNLNEYIEIASTVAEVSGFPTPSALNEMLKIFSVLGKKCVVTRNQNDGMCSEYEMEETINEEMATFLRNALKRKDRAIFPSSDKWVSLSDKPLRADDKSLLKIFQNLDRVSDEEKKEHVFFLNLGDLFQPQQKRVVHNRRKAQPGRDDLKKNVSHFLKICEVKTLSECVRKELITTLVEFNCAPLKRYFHNVMPHVQRFLYSKIPDMYDELKSQGFPQKLFKMQFASVKSLETVYFLTTHPDIRVPVEEKAGVETVGVSYCLYVLKNSIEHTDVLDAEIVKLLLGEKKENFSEILNFLAVMRSYDGSDVDVFLEDVQGLEPLPDDEEPWCVPAPPEVVVPEPKDDPPPAAVATTNAPSTFTSGAGGLHSWPPKSAAQYDKTRIPESVSAENSVLKMWPPPAPPDSVIPNQVIQAQERTTQAVFLAESSHGIDIKGGENDENVYGILRQNQPLHLFVSEEPMQEKRSDRPNCQQIIPLNEPNTLEVLPETNMQKAPGSDFVEVVKPSENVQSTLPGMVQINPDPSRVHEVVSLGTGSDLQARPILPSHAYLWFENGVSDLDFENLEFNNGTRMLNLADNASREDVGRWGERCVYEYLVEQAHQLPPGDIEIIWMNENGNTIVPYDLEVRRRVSSEQNPVITYIEVKTTSSDQKDFFEVSVQELQFALVAKQAFHVYRVFNALNPERLRIRRLRNLASQLESKNVKLCLVI